MIKVGIIGGGGYTAGELIRLVLLHPNAELVSVVSESQSKLPISSTHLELNGWLDMNFSDHLEDNLDVVFLCSLEFDSLKPKNGIFKMITLDFIEFFVLI